MNQARITAAFDRAASALAGDDATVVAARGFLAEVRAQLGRRQRIALAGRISSGKSTLANALLGADLAPTGALELTFNVSRFRYAETPALTVHFTDGPPRHHELSELRRLAVRAAARDDELRALLGRVDHLEVGLPDRGLADFDLIDTPGLDSAYRADSANALRWLGRSAADVTGLSVRHASRADALILVFDRGLARTDADLLADFTRAGLGESGPVTTVGVLTKVEQYWPEHDDPLAQGRRVAATLMRTAGAGRLLFDLRPLASLVGAGAALLRTVDLEDLAALARLPAPRLLAPLRLGPVFAGRELPELPVPRERRAALHARLGGYGIALACELIRAGCTTLDELRAALGERSGLTSFRQLLREHFAARSEVIVLDRAIRELRRLTGDPRLERAVAEVAALEFQEHAFGELATLRDHYAGRLAFGPTETEDLLRITGERGRTPAARLGLPVHADAAQLAERARARGEHWAMLAAYGVHTGRSRVAVRRVQRAYDVLLHEISGRQAAGQRR
jgi:energy-coupling factor transporter ATP-binding protein EcfA2